MLVCGFCYFPITFNATQKTHFSLVLKISTSWDLGWGFPFISGPHDYWSKWEWALVPSLRVSWDLMGDHWSKGLTANKHVSQSDTSAHPHFTCGYQVVISHDLAHNLFSFSSNSMALKQYSGCLHYIQLTTFTDNNHYMNYSQNLSHQVFSIES